MGRDGKAGDAPKNGHPKVLEGSMSKERSTVEGQLKNKVAVVTGAARGIGRAAAIALAREGANIVGIDICSAVYSPSGVKPATPAVCAGSSAFPARPVKKFTRSAIVSPTQSRADRNNSPHAKRNSDFLNDSISQRPHGLATPEPWPGQAAAICVTIRGGARAGC